MRDDIFSLMLRLQKESIGMFARVCLQGSMGKDVLYDTMNLEDLNWRKFHDQVAHKTVQMFNGRVIFTASWTGMLKKASAKIATPRYFD